VPFRGDGNLVRAWGFASAYKNTGLGGGAPDISNAEVELYDNGTFEVRSSSAEMGQGLVTVMRLTVAEEMAVSPEQVKVLVMDTDLTPNGGPTTASRQTYVTGNVMQPKRCVMPSPQPWRRNMMSARSRSALKMASSTPMGIP
jgi:xanthine dehydrogenase molybdenum-binding subunit